ncbi:hypothetical protein SeMB42_g00839 [Synchytrium endobioticum]|nr:hypothetical protein SeMB42_g00839 [Synchytrium endobioticum]
MEPFEGVVTNELIMSARPQSKGPTAGVRAVAGYIIECDPAAKQILKKVHEESSVNERFIVEDLDETHLLVKDDMDRIREAARQLDQILELNTYRVADTNR